MRASWLALVVAACSSDPSYIVEGTVVDVSSPTQIVVDHQDIPGFMPAMTMPFEVRDASVIDGVKPGDRIVARLVVAQQGSYLERVRVTGSAPVAPPTPGAEPPLHAGEVLPAVTLPVTGGGDWTVGAGQPGRTVLGFVYTTCPLPEFCPATIARLQGLQGALPAGARIVLVTIDPTTDTLPVLDAFAAQVGARPDVWRFARLEGDALAALARRAALTVDPSSGNITHNTRLLVLDADGTLIERYDDNRWPLDRVVSQLSTGAPHAPPGSDGTLTPDASQGAGAPQ